MFVIEKNIIGSILSGQIVEDKNCRHMNSLLHHGYILRLLALKGNPQYLLKTFREKFRLGKTLNKVLKQQRQQDRKIEMSLYNKKQNSFHINSVFLFSKTNFIIQKIVMYILNFIFLIQVLRIKFGQSRRWAGVQTPSTPPFRCTAALIQSSSRQVTMLV